MLITPEVFLNVYFFKYITKQKEIKTFEGVTRLIREPNIFLLLIPEYETSLQTFQK